jgi:ABC-type Fe3+-hydroxamate transport system substrate-binding protein
VTDIQTLDQALSSLRAMFTAGLRWPAPGWLELAEQAWRAPPPGLPVRAVIPVWRDPWMVVGSRTFTGDVAARLGLDNVYGDHAERYPRVELAGIRDREPDLVVLPDEPYPFAAADGPEAFPHSRVALVAGRDLTWYGPSLITARSALLAQLAAARPVSGKP